MFAIKIIIDTRMLVRVFSASVDFWPTTSVCRWKLIDAKFLNSLLVKIGLLVSYINIATVCNNLFISYAVLKGIGCLFKWFFSFFIP